MQQHCNTHECQVKQLDKLNYSSLFLIQTTIKKSIEDRQQLIEVKR